MSPDRGDMGTTWIQVKREELRPPRNDQQARELLQTSFRQLVSKKTAGTRHSVKRTSSLTPEGKKRRPASGRGCTLLFFLGRAGKLRVAVRLCTVLCAFCVSVSFSENIFWSGDTSQQAESHEKRSRIKPMKYANGVQAFSRLLLF